MVENTTKHGEPSGKDGGVCLSVQFAGAMGICDLAYQQVLPAPKAMTKRGAYDSPVGGAADQGGVWNYDERGTVAVG